MMQQRGLLFTLAALAVGLVLARPALAAEPKQLKPSQSWSASIDDEDLMKEAPAGGTITDAKGFAKLWKAWKMGDKVPEIDFAKEIVLVATTRGSRLNLSARVDDKGNLTSAALATRDLRPGFRYQVIVVSRDGVKTVNGKDLPGGK
jgi:hypothetical protein